MARPRPSPLAFRFTGTGIFIGTILTATSVSISAQTLLEIGAFRSREGATILGAAVIDDVMGIVLLSVVVALAKASASRVDPMEIGRVALRLVVFFGLALAAAPWLRAVLAWASRLPVSQAMLSAAVVIAMFYAWAAEYVGQVAAITGAYIAGVLIAQTEFKKEIDGGVHPLAYSIFVPVFFIGIGLQANGRELAIAALYRCSRARRDCRQGSRVRALCQVVRLHAAAVAARGVGMIFLEERSV